MYRLFYPYFLLVQGSQTYVEFESLTVLPKWSRGNKVEEYPKWSQTYHQSQVNQAHTNNNRTQRNNTTSKLLQLISRQLNMANWSGEPQKE